MKPFRTTIRVQYSDTDKMMVVYHANYLKYFQTARTEYFREAGFPYSDMEKDDFQMPVLSVNAKFREPAVYDEMVSVSCHIVKLGPASMEFEYEIRDAETGLLHVTGHSRHGFTNQALRPIPLKRKHPELYGFIEKLYQRDAEMNEKN